MMRPDTLQSEMRAEMNREHERELERMHESEQNRSEPGAECAECGCPDNTLGRNGIVCAACNAPWPIEGDR